MTESNKPTAPSEVLDELRREANRKLAQHGSTICSCGWCTSVRGLLAIADSQVEALKQKDYWIDFSNGERDTEIAEKDKEIERLKVNLAEFIALNEDDTVSVFKVSGELREKAERAICDLDFIQAAAHSNIIQQLLAITDSQAGALAEKDKEIEKWKTSCMGWVDRHGGLEVEIYKLEQQLAEKDNEIERLKGELLQANNAHFELNQEITEQQSTGVSAELREYLLSLNPCDVLTGKGSRLIHDAVRHIQYLEGLASEYGKTSDRHNLEITNIADKLAEKDKEIERLDTLYTHELYKNEQQSTGWESGYPTGKGLIVYQVHGTNDIAFLDYDGKTGPDFMPQHFRIPDPPKKELVVECCEFGREHFMRNDDNDGWLLFAVEKSDKAEHTENHAASCICGKPLPEEK